MQFDPLFDSETEPLRTVDLDHVQVGRQWRAGTGMHGRNHRLASPAGVRDSVGSQVRAARCVVPSYPGTGYPLQWPLPLPPVILS